MPLIIDMCDLETMIETATMLRDLAVVVDVTYAAMITGCGAYQGYRHTFGLKSAIHGVQIMWALMARVDANHLFAKDISAAGSAIDSKYKSIYLEYGLADSCGQGTCTSAGDLPAIRTPSSSVSEERGKGSLSSHPERDPPKR